MNNRLIYVLIGLMLVSLIGIIWIQNSWIRDAIAEREREFKVHVNDALNAVNDAIDSDENEFFIKRRFGGLDSLANTVVFMEKDSTRQIRVDLSAERYKPSMEEEVIIVHDDGSRERRIEIHSTDSIVSDERIHPHDVWHQRVERQMTILDSTLKHEELAVERVHNIESMVEHYTFEMMLTGDLKDRISAKDLRKKLQKALKKEGIHASFEYAVVNAKSGDIEEGYVSNGYDASGKAQGFEKKLFQHDRRDAMSYNLVVQPKDGGNYVWSRVWKMTTLSILFTTLIVISFGYALYFIFRQKKISQVKNDFINNMTHELKTPLASITLATASINHPEIINNPDEVRRLTKLIDTEKERINSHVERVLDTAALDAGEIQLKLQPVHIEALFQRAKKNIDLPLLSTGGMLDIEGPADLVIEADAFHLTNVLTNILDNSIKYSQAEPPRIFAMFSGDETMCTITITDHGMGMTAKEQKRAFDTFYRAETGDVHNRKGFGLGLSYAKGVVEKHKGDITLKSQPGKGTTVTITLPLHQS